MITYQELGTMQHALAILYWILQQPKYKMGIKIFILQIGKLMFKGFNFYVQIIGCYLQSHHSNLRYIPKFMCFPWHYFARMSEWLDGQFYSFWMSRNFDPASYLSSEFKIVLAPKKYEDERRKNKGKEGNKTDEGNEQLCIPIACYP